MWAANAIAIFGVINIVYAAFVCLGQTDLKKLIAYSSVSHMGFTLLGMAAFTPAAISGAVLNLFTHGIISPMLFLIVGVIYDRAHHREIAKFGGLAQELPEYSAIMGLAFFASLGLPGLAGFISEFMVFSGAFPVFTTYTIISALERHHHGRLLPVGDPPDVPRQAQPGVQGLPGPQLARAAHPLPARRDRDRPRLLPAGGPRADQPRPCTRSSRTSGRCRPRDEPAMESLIPLVNEQPALRAVVPAGAGAHVRDARPVRDRPLLEEEPARVAYLTVGALAVLGVTAVLLARQPPDAQSPLQRDDRERRVRAASSSGSSSAPARLTVFVAAQGKDFPPARIGEFYALLMAVVLGMFLMASATDLLMIYLSIELVSMVSYVLAGFRKGDRKAAEGSLKYVIYGGVASGVMLFGMSYLYGLTGTTSLHRDRRRASRPLQAAGPSLAATKIALVVVDRLRHGRHRLQGRGGAVAHVVPGRVRGRAHAVHRVPLGRPEGGRLRPRAPLLPLRPRRPRQRAGRLRRRARGHPLAGRGRGDRGGHDDARQPHRARPDQPEAPPRVLLHRARGLRAHGPLRGLRPRDPGRHDLHARVPRDERRRLRRRHPRRRGDRLRVDPRLQGARDAATRSRRWRSRSSSSR